MPFTPFHFGPSSCVALPLKRYIDFPVFVFVNVIVDLEPLAVMLFGLNYPLHGYCHTFLIGSLVGILWAVVAYSGKGILQKLMRLLHLSYKANFTKMLFSAVLGIWFHILLDALIYPDIRPFYPLMVNPMYGIITGSAVYLICIISFIPALILYTIGVVSFVRKNRLAASDGTM